MEGPRISLGSIMIVVFAVAADGVAMRSVSDRPTIGQGVFELILLLTLPMANLLAVVLATLIWDGRTPRAFRVGFFIGGALAVAITAFGTRAGLSWLESILESTEFGAWLAASPTRGMAFGYVVLPGLALLLQALTAAAFGRLAKALTTGTETLVCDSVPRRRRLAAPLTAMLLIAAPAVLIEGYQRWTIDPTLARLPVGSKAVVDIRVMNGWRVSIRDGSTFLLPNGFRVRVDDDSRPSAISGVKTPRGEQLGDHRSVRVTLLDGERTGEPTSVPRQFLRSVQ
jgi:hypothetical protein